jgi:hypothetical protein
MSISPNDVFPAALYALYDGRYGQLADVLALKAGQSSGVVAYATRAELYADLAHAANTPGMVLSDSTPAYNCYYIKIGGSGAGSWSAANWPFRTVAYVSEYVTLNAAISALNTAAVPATLLLNAPSTLAASITTNSNVEIVAMPSGLITLNSGQTLTVGGAFTAGMYQVFSGTGAVAGLKESYVIWFGTTAAAQQAAFDATSSRVIYTPGTYTNTTGIIKTLTA